MNEPDLTQIANEIWGRAQTHDPHEPEFRAAIAALPAAQPAPDEWRDVLQWTDSGEKTLIDWYSGGGDPAGEFARMGLRREMPDGSVVYRTYVATGPWGEPTSMPQPAPVDPPLSPNAVDASPAPVDAKVAALVELEAELRTMKTAGIIEVAVRNPNVAEYMRHWEGRAEAAEAALAALDVQPAPDLIQIKYEAHRTGYEAGTAAGETLRASMARRIRALEAAMDVQPAPDAPPLSPNAVDASPAPDTDAKVAALVEAGSVMANALRGDYIVPGSAAAWFAALAAWEGRGNE
jgi:hypothetical protein